MSETNFRRYTDLPSLIQVLTNRRITLLDPSSWDDKNDSFFLTMYREKQKLKSVLALCFTSAPETYHHWRVFSPGPSGVCIHFDDNGLKAALQDVPDVTFRKIRYVKVEVLRKRTPAVSSLPFIKRFPFHPECEYRALWQSKNVVCSSMDIPIDLSAITRITLSPWLHPNLWKNVSATLKHIDGCKGIRLWRSTLTENAAWKEYGRRAS